jgi:O-antigen ligase
MLFALTLTFSRGGFLAAILSIALLFLIDSNGRSRLVLLVSIVIAVIAFSLANTVITNTLLDRFYLKDDNLRFTLWKYAWENFLAHWPIGMGLGSRILADGSNLLNDRLDAHNLVLGALMETGVIGSFGFLMLYALVIRTLTRCIKAYRRAVYRHMEIAGLYAGLIGALFHAMIEPNFRGAVYMVLFWMLVSVAITQLDLAARSQEAGACPQS